LEKSTTAQKLFAEALGSALLLATVVGSGIMGAALASGNDAIALLGNTIPTGAILFVLITIIGPVSGAHFNPAVTLAMAITGRLPAAQALPYILCQIAGAVVGVFLAHAMFDLSILQFSSKLRWSAGQWVAEATATFGLLVVIFGCLRYNIAAIPAAVGLYITAAYWFTASTSFANPAVTLARALTDTFAGIKPEAVLPFIAAQLLGAALAIPVANYLFPKTEGNGARV
jgi:glycerol uptake facilitator-like aquaporin